MPFVFTVCDLDSSSNIRMRDQLQNKGKKIHHWKRRTPHLQSLELHWKRKKIKSATHYVSLPLRTPLLQVIPPVPIPAAEGAVALAGVAMAVQSWAGLRRAAGVARRCGPLKLHLEVDTGIGRTRPWRPQEPEILRP